MAARQNTRFRPALEALEDRLVPSRFPSVGDPPSPITRFTPVFPQASFQFPEPGIAGTGLSGAGLPGTGIAGTGLSGAGLPGTGVLATGLSGAGVPGTGLPGGVPHGGAPKFTGNSLDAFFASLTASQLPM